MRILYRASQFWNAVGAKSARQDIAQASQALTPELMALFLAMHPGEQAHSLAIYNQLLAQGETDQDLLVAALLHDVGKTRCPLRLWERVAIVLGRAFLPTKARQWGQGQPNGWQRQPGGLRRQPGGWRRPFVVAEQHPAWGAEMAEQAGASPGAACLIRHHQDKSISQPGPGNPLDCQGELLHRLQLLDNES